MSDVLLVLLIVLGVIFVWRGPKTLPKLASALGRGVKEARTEASRRLDESRDATVDPAAEDRPDRQP